MTKKDYIKIAGILKKFYKSDLKGHWQDIQFLIDEFAYWLENDNSNFNEQKFRDYIFNNLTKKQKEDRI